MSLGNALWALGKRESGTVRLEEAVAAYRAALAERTRARAARLGRDAEQSRRCALGARGALAPAMAELLSAGITSLQGTARALNERGVPTAAKGKWSAVQVRRVLARLPRPSPLPQADPAG
jgi:hypothetical protein